jgi:hypothetical protein
LYLRHSVRRKSGKQHSYWRLVRSVRRGGKVVQETVAQLGELDAEGRANARLLAQQITGGAQQQGELFEAAAPDPQRVAVRLDQVCVQRARWFGGVWLGWKLWRALQLDELCAALMPEGREAVPWAQMAAVLVIARLTAPSSELHYPASPLHRRPAASMHPLKEESPDVISTRPPTCRCADPQSGDGARIPLEFEATFYHQSVNQPWFQMAQVDPELPCMRARTHPKPISLS